MAFDPQEHLMKVRGGQLYLEVKWRLIWLREMHPDASVEVELTHLDLDGKMAVARATVTLPNGTKATEIGSETEKDFPAGWVEKAATKAVGRALAALGFGTQFALELDEGDAERPADSPVAAKNGSAGSTPVATRPAQTTAPAAATTPTRSGGATVTAPVPQPAADQSAALRAEVVALLADDGPALALLQRQKKPLPPAQDGATLAKTKTWLLQRKKQQRPKSARLAESIAQASTEDAIKLVLTDARRAQEKKEITEAEYKALYQAGVARKAELSAPLLSGTQGQAQVAS